MAIYADGVIHWVGIVEVIGVSKKWVRDVGGAVVAWCCARFMFFASVGIGTPFPYLGEFKKCEKK